MPRVCCVVSPCYAGGPLTASSPGEISGYPGDGLVSVVMLRRLWLVLGGTWAGVVLADVPDEVLDGEDGQDVGAVLG